MRPERFDGLLARMEGLRLVVLGDVSLDRYLEIDPAREEISIETDLPVHNVTRVRAQAGAAGTVINNLAALGIGRVDLLSFSGVDGEGFELLGALKAIPGLSLDGFHQSQTRRTLTYTKPLVIESGAPPRELNRLDMKNWTPTAPELWAKLAADLSRIGASADGIIVLEQVELPEVGVMGPPVYHALESVRRSRPQVPVLADSRRGLDGYPPLSFKWNRVEFLRAQGLDQGTERSVLESLLSKVARDAGCPVFVTLAEDGILGADSAGAVCHRPSIPVRGPIDVVGCGDAVSAALLSVLAAGGTVTESMEFAMAAASLALHQLGTTGVPSHQGLRELLVSS